MLTECPNCSSIWGFDEMEWQECFCCGYPRNEDLDEWDDDACDDEDGEYEKEDPDGYAEDNDPNDGITITNTTHVTYLTK